MASDTLKGFLQEFFCFDDLKAVGFFGCDVGAEDYEKQELRICKYFGLENIYEYGKDEIRAHISFGVDGKPFEDGRPLKVDKDGRLITEPFVTVFKNIYE